MPTVQQVCEQWGLNDVDLEYTDADFQNLTTYKLFQQSYRPRIKAENPKVPISKLVMPSGESLRAVPRRPMIPLTRIRQGHQRSRPALM